MKKWNKRGFTLVEMLIVVAIIAVLAAVCIPLYAAHLRSTREAVCAENRLSLRDLLYATYLLDGSAESVEQEYQAKKAQYICPLGGTLTYQISEEHVIVTCTHLADPLSNVEQMQTLRAKLSSLPKTNTLYNSNSSAADQKKIADALKEIGVNLDDFTTWALLHSNGSYPKLYWSDVDISSITSGTTYVMAYTMTTGHYTVWKVNVVNGQITGEVNNGIQNPNVADQTYDKMVEKYNELMHTE